MQDSDIQKPRRRRHLKGLALNRMIPNILTLLALCAGMTAIRFALQERWEMAVLAIVIAAILDILDGSIARLLKGASKFGAELDSLSDFICFGVAPAIMLYLWTLEGSGRFAWILALLYSACCALRLARFNTVVDDPDKPAWSNRFFTGVPAPAGAGVVLSPMVLSFVVGEELARRPETVAAVLVVVAALLVSRIPTFSFKNAKVPNPWVLPTMVLVVVFAAVGLAAPWYTYSVCAGLYVVSIPFSMRSYRRLLRRSDEVDAERAATKAEPAESGLP